MNRHATAFLLAGFDADLAAHLAVAARGYVRAHESDGRVVPPGVVEVGEALEDYRQFLRDNLCHSLAGSRHRADTDDVRVRGPWLTVTDAASIVSVHRRTLYRHIRDGRLGHTIINGTMRIHVQDLIDYRRDGQCK